MCFQFHIPTVFLLLLSSISQESNENKIDERKNMQKDRIYTEGNFLMVNLSLGMFGDEFILEIFEKFQKIAVEKLIVKDFNIFITNF